MQIKIEKLANGGSGLGEYEGKKIFIPYSAPGDILDINITKDHGNWAEGQIVSIITPAACRVTPKCPVFGICGGCQWQHISYETQIKWKKDILAETIEKIGKVDKPNMLETLASPKQWYYRNRIQLHVDSHGHVGFYRPRSKEVVEFEECAIAEEKLNTELKANRGEFAKRDRGVALRVDADEASFSQINTGQNEQLKNVLADWFSEVPHETILELYCGSGNFTFTLAKLGEHVVASDIDGRAIRIAQKKQAAQNVGNVEFICAPAKRAARRLHGNCNAVLVDPPRNGCAEAIDEILALKPKTIFYISCDPSTMSRDALALAKQGFKLVRTLPIDMFPQTFHIESLSMFSI